MATAILQVRVDTDLKKRVEGKLKHMGLNMSTAVNIFLHQIDNQNRIPFTIAGKEENNDDLPPLRGKQSAGMLQQGGMPDGSKCQESEGVSE